MNKIVGSGIALMLVGGVLIAAGYSVLGRCSSNSLSLLSQAKAGTWTEGPLRAAVQFRLAASPDKVFTYLSSEQALPKWMPGLDSLRYDHANSETVDTLAEGSRRTMMFSTQVELEEIVYFSPSNAIAYQIIEGVPVRNHLAVMSLESHGEGGSMLTWEQYFDIKWSSLYGWLMPFMVRRFMSDGQVNLVNTFGGESVTACKSRFF